MESVGISLGLLAIVLCLISIDNKLKRIADALTETPVPRQFDVAPSIFNQS